MWSCVGLALPVSVLVPPLPGAPPGVTLGANPEPVGCSSHRVLGYPVPIAGCSAVTPPGGCLASLLLFPLPLS